MLGFKKILGKKNNSPSDSTQFELGAFQSDTNFENDFLWMRWSDIAEAEKKTDGGSYVKLEESPSHVPSITQEKKYSPALNFSYQPSKPIPINGHSRPILPKQSGAKSSCSAPIQQGSLKYEKERFSETFSNSFHSQPSSILDYTALDDSEDATDDFYVGSPNGFDRERNRKSAFK